MKTIQKMIDVMRAFDAGKTIEFECGNDFWLEEPNPSWDWKHNNYRIKQELQKPEYVPYENQSEFLIDQKIHGPYVSFKNRLNELRFFIPSLVVNDGVYIHFGGDNEDVLVKYSNLKTWQDGTPCGKLKQ